MGSSEEIMEVFEQEVAEKSRVVLSKFGPAPFYDGFRGMGVDSVYPRAFLEVCAAVRRADLETK